MSFVIQLFFILKTNSVKIPETDLSLISTTLAKTKTSSEKLETERIRPTAASQYSTQFDQIKNSGTSIDIIELNRYAATK